MLRRRNARFHERPRPNFMSDVYTFAMCILEAVTLEMPWAESEDQVFVDVICRDQLPRRPASLIEAQWTLIRKMCAFEPTQRSSIDYVVAQSRQITPKAHSVRGSMDESP